MTTFIEGNMYYELNKGDYTGEKPRMYHEFKYEPDHFQLYGFKAIEQGDNILVTAHTGAGKTALAIYAIAKWLEISENQIIYCSPIKALSNQKHLEFKEIFDKDGSNNIGVLTGDVKVNPNGRVIIMTAEILRNSLLKTNAAEDSYDFNFNPEAVKCVILDEVHYINNEERGKVWEEIITNLNPNIQLVMLSATISGAENLASWVGNLKKVKCHHIPTAFRPVPLNHYIYDYTQELIGKHPMRCISNGKKGTNESGWVEGSWSDVFTNIGKYMKKNNGRYRNPDTVLYDCIKYCKENLMLPINLFVLNRDYLEKLAKSLVLSCVDKDEIKEINQIWDKYLLKYRDTYQHSDQWRHVHDLVNRGIGIHHSGMIPILKEIVEILYEKKLVKVLFATETFAMGVNMPTRTVVFHRISKFDGRGKRALKPEEYIQMAGRAGRRGLDDYGNVIILPDMDMKNELDAKNMIKSDPQVLKSRLHLDYSFLLKRMVLMHDRGEKDVFEFIGNNISSTMFSLEENKIANSMRKSNIKLLEEKTNELSKVNNELSNIVSNNLTEDEHERVVELCETIVKINKDIEFSNQHGFSIKANAMKKYNKTIKESKDKIVKLSNVKESFVDSYVTNYSLSKKLNTEVRKLEEVVEEESAASKRFKVQIDLLLDFLIEFNMVTNNDNNYQLTSLGRIVAEVNECNPLLMGYIIQENLFDDLEFHEIVAVLSVFVSERHEDAPFISELNASDNSKYVLNCIKSHIDNLESYEDKHINELPYVFRSNWDFNLPMFEVISEWAKGECVWGEIKELYFKYFSFEGNFCRNILRLVNLLRNVEAIAVMCNKVSLINKIKGYPEKLSRDIVTTDSLYI